MFVLFTDSVNKRVVPAVVMVLNIEECEMQHHSGNVCAQNWGLGFEFLARWKKWNVNIPFTVWCITSFPKT
jgi:hypothetical protein